MPHEIDPYANQFIFNKTRQMAQRPLPPGVDEDDIRSLLTLHLVRKRDQFDPNLGAWTTFVKVVVTHGAYDLREKFDRELVNSMTIHLTDEISSQLTCSERLRHRQVHNRTDEEHVDLKADVTTVVGYLPDGDQQLCGELSRTTTAEAARNLKRSRSHVYERKDAIHNAMRNGELHEYG